MLNAARDVERITSRQNPIVRTFRELAAEPAADGGRLLLEGLHLVDEARAAGLAFERVAVAAEELANESAIGRLAAAMARGGVPVVAASAPVMDALSPVRSPSGIVAIAARPTTTVGAICRQANALIVAPVDVQDPGNLGALLRAAEAGGATGVVVCGASASPFSWKSVRGSMGSVLRLPVATAAAEDVRHAARGAGVRLIASVPRGGRSPDAIDWRGPALVFVGGEGPGLPQALVAGCDEAVTIPMTAPVESLNVAVAAALLVYEARRQRRLS